MVRSLIKFFKKIVVSFFLLYGLNCLISSLHIYIPINIFTLGLTTFLGFPGLTSLIIMFFIVQ